VQPGRGAAQPVAVGTRGDQDAGDLIENLGGRALDRADVDPGTGGVVTRA